jgi:4'-phosphopantetheinyl transferase
MNRDGIAEPRSSGDGPAPPPVGEVHVWRVELAGDDRRGAARGSLTAILAAYLGGPAATELAADPSGKPRLASAPERLSFNISHSDDLALVAVAAGDTPVGIDVERLKPRRDLVRLAARWLPAEDAAAVAAAPETEPPVVDPEAASATDRERAFYAAWTRHEARVKCTGAGLGGSPGPEVVARQLEVDPGYAAAVAFVTAGAGPRIVLRDACGRA